MASVYVYSLDSYAGGVEDGGISASDLRMQLKVLLTREEIRFLLHLLFGYTHREVLDSMGISNRRYYVLKNRIAAKMIDAGLAEDDILVEIKEIIREKGVYL